MTLFIIQFTKYYYGDETTEDNVGMVCSTHRGDKNAHRIFSKSIDDFLRVQAVACKHKCRQTDRLFVSQTYRVY
jgi:hypothetical protein